jgi:putative endonuclease
VSVACGKLTSVERRNSEAAIGDRAETGRAGEAAALAWYRSAGYRLVARNWTCRAGEVDLILARGRTVVFCEVKTRRGSAFGDPFEAVTWRKQEKLRLLAETYLAGGGKGRNEVRFDVASVIVAPDGHPSVHVFEQAF